MEEHKDIEDDYLENETPYETLTERAFTSVYHVNPDDKGHYKLMLHSNKICLMALSPNHPIILQDLNVTAVNFQERCLNNKVSGKKKHGSEFLTLMSIICKIHCEGVSTPFTVRSNLVAKLIEINENLIKNPNLIKSSEKGYIVIVSPKLNEYDREIGRWTAEDEYKKGVKPEDSAVE